MNRNVNLKKSRQTKYNDIFNTPKEGHINSGKPVGFIEPKTEPIPISNISSYIDVDKWGNQYKRFYLSTPYDNNIQYKHNGYYKIKEW